MTAQSSPGANLRHLARATFGNAVRESCREHGCSLSLTGIDDYAVVKGEDVIKSSKACDCIVIHDTLPPRVSLVELKSGNVKQTQVLEKFLSTSRLIPLIERNVLGNRKCHPKLLLLIKGRKRKFFYVFWRAQKIKINGKRHSVQVLPCGSELANSYADR